MMKKILKIGSFLIIVISLILLPRAIKEFDTQKNGTLTTVTVFSVPISCDISSKRIKAYFEFYIENKKYSKNFDGHCDLKPGDRIKLITNNDNTIFLFEDENPIYGIIPVILIFVFGTICFLKSYNVSKTL
jgi:hypothetical protein